MTYGLKHSTNVPMKVLIFLVALCLLRLCSFKHFCRTLPEHTWHNYLPRRHDQKHADLMKTDKTCGMNVNKVPNCEAFISGITLEQIQHCTDINYVNSQR